MNNILDLARQAGLYKPPCGVYYAVSDRQLQAFAALVRDAALEEAAVVCDGQANRASLTALTASAAGRHDALRKFGQRSAGASVCAEAIRALKEPGK